MADLPNDPRAYTYEGWILALNIFSKYSEEGLQGYYDLAADHDILYMGDKPEPLSVGEDEDGDACYEWAEADKKDAETLLSLGFFYDEEQGCWACFV